MTQPENRLEPIFLGKTFEDFLIRPQFSSALSRRQIDLRSRVTRDIHLNVPIVGANMDTVTGENMAKTLALEGCVGVLDRNVPMKLQMERVEYVKRQHAHIIEEPVVVDEHATIGEVKRIIREQNVSGILVGRAAPKPNDFGEDAKVLLGILSHRDILAADEDDSSSVTKYMTLRHRLTVADSRTDIEEAEKIMLAGRIEKLPVVDVPTNIIIGLITLRDLRLAKKKPYSLKDRKGRLIVGAAIGAQGDFMDRAARLIEAEADFLVMDVAHAHSVVVKNAVERFRKEFGSFPLVVGNVATYEGARFLAFLGVDGIKVGIGPGRGCLTRLETGAGVPQLQAIREAYLAARDHNIPVIADGGIRKDKDIALSLLAGAEAVMLGSMLSGTDESPGEIIEDGGKKYKLYRGMTSPEAVLAGLEEGETAQDALATPSEGKQLKVEYVGSVVDIINRITGHLRSSVSYAGELTLADARQKFSENPELFIELSAASRKESFDR